MGNKIIVTISETGETEISVEGVTGKHCLGLTKTVEEALGMATDRKLKPDYFKQPVLEKGGQSVKR